MDTISYLSRSSFKTSTKYAAHQAIIIDSAFIIWYCHSSMQESTGNLNYFDAFESAEYSPSIKKAEQRQRESVISVPIRATYAVIAGEAIQVTAECADVSTTAVAALLARHFGMAYDEMAE